MSRHKRNTGARHDRTNLYSEITDKIIAELEAGRVPWVQPWGTAAAKAPLAMPKNASTSRPYSGINVLLLWGAVIERGFSGHMPMVAALSAAHLAAILFPPALRRLYIVRDDDPAGDGARDNLIERANAAGIEAIVLSPALGDFNEDLRSFGIDALRASSRTR